MFLKVATIRMIETSCPDVDFTHEIKVGDVVYPMSRTETEPFGFITHLHTHKATILVFCEPRRVSMKLSNLIFTKGKIQFLK